MGMEDDTLYTMLVSRFHRIGSERRGEDEDAVADEQIAVLSRLEDLGDPRVPQFLVEVARSRGEIDLVRIEAVKAVRVYAGLTHEGRRLVGRLLAELASGEPDDLVRSHAAGSLAFFLDVPGVVDAAAGVLADRGAGVDVRCGCLRAVERAGKAERAVALLRSLAGDPEMGRYVGRVLREWGEDASGA